VEFLFFVAPLASSDVSPIYKALSKVFLGFLDQFRCWVEAFENLSSGLSGQPFRCLDTPLLPSAHERVISVLEHTPVQTGLVCVRTGVTFPLVLFLPNALSPQLSHNEVSSKLCISHLKDAAFLQQPTKH
jgi:hypothetical protein